MRLGLRLSASVLGLALLAFPRGPVLAGGVGGIVARDGRGKVIPLPRPASRVVCLIESALSELYMLGAGDRIVGIPAQVYGEDLFPWYARLDPRIAARGIATPGNWDFVSLESVLARTPDLVVMWSEQRESIRALEERGVPVFGVFVHGIADLRAQFLALGELLGKGARAVELLAYVDAEIARLRSRLAGGPRIPTYFAWGGGMLETSCGGSMVDDLLRIAGGENVCGDARAEHRQISVERLWLWDPAVIFLWPDPNRRPVQVATDRRLAELSAIRKNALVELPLPFLADQWTLKYLHAAKAMAKGLHPDRFRDMDLVAESRAMLRVLYGGRL